MICVWDIMDITEFFRMKMALIHAALNSLGRLKKENKLFFTKDL
jgi:hypothetical protein